MSNKQLLVIEPYAFLPIDSGGKNRIFHTIEQLSNYITLQVFFYYTNQDNKKTTEQFLESKHIPVKAFKTHSKMHGFYFKTGIPYWFSDWYNPNLIQALKQLDQNQDVIIEFTQLLYLVNYLPLGVKKTFVAHDISTVSFWRRLKDETNLIKKLIHFFRWLEIYLYERKYLPKYDETIAVSEVDAQILKKRFGLKRVTVIPNGIEKVELLPQREKDSQITLGFIGSDTHPPNQQAIQFLINAIVPELERQRVNFKLIIAGINNLNSHNDHIQIDGYINDLKDFYSQIDLLVAPLFAGSGSRIKILESLSFGKPVLTTQVGAEGLEIGSSFLEVIPVNLEKGSAVWARAIKQLKTLTSSEEEVRELTNQLSYLTWDKVLSMYLKPLVK